MYNLIKYQCNTIIPSHLSNFVALAREETTFAKILDSFEFFASLWSEVALFWPIIFFKLTKAEHKVEHKTIF